MEIDSGFLFREWKIDNGLVPVEEFNSVVEGSSLTHEELNADDSAADGLWAEEVLVSNFKVKLVLAVLDINLHMLAFPEGVPVAVNADLRPNKVAKSMHESNWEV